jgi:hypothetical protein
MDAGEDGSASWLTLSEAAPRMGLTVDGLRSRIRRGLVKPRRGNDGRLLVALSVEGAEGGHGPVQPGHEPIHDDDEAERLSATVTELREEVMEARLAAGQAAAERDAANAMLADARAKAERLEAQLVEARKPALVRLIEAFRRR